MFGPRPEVLLERFRFLKSDISRLRSKLNESNEQKEINFKKKEDLKKEIKSLIREAIEFKNKKDKSNESVQLLKNQRNLYNNEIKQLIEKIKLSLSQRAKVTEKEAPRINSSKIKENMDRIEHYIETEVISFKKEKELMDQIKRLRQTYNQISQFGDITKQIREMYAKIDDLRDKARTVHKKLQNVAQKSQDDYLEFIKRSKQIGKLKKEQEAAFQAFLRFKREFVNANEALKQKLSEAGRLEQELNKINLIKKREESSSDNNSNNKILQTKLKEVEDKIKSGRKLTTEDLLVYQKSK
ncbi:MAG: hypothetical protein V1824_01645 [archaeon]